MFFLKNLLWIVLIMQSTTIFSQVKPDLIKLSSVDKTIIQDPRYAGNENFLGRKVAGYTTQELYCTPQAAQALKQVSSDMKKKGFTLVVYDAYRPQRAVDDFVTWRSEKDNAKNKAKYYPTLSKKEIFEGGYVAEKSEHSKGSTFDLTIIPSNQKLKPVTVSTRILANGESIPLLDDNTLDMGSSFDLFHPVSHHGTNLISAKQTSNRTILRESMKAHGFLEIHEEWWHYTLANQPYPDTYFDWVDTN